MLVDETVLKLEEEAGKVEDGKVLSGMLEEVDAVWMAALLEHAVTGEHLTGLH